MNILNKITKLNTKNINIKDTIKKQVDFIILNPHLLNMYI